MAAPRRSSWFKLSDVAQCEIARRCRTLGRKRTAASLHIGVVTLEDIIDGGTAKKRTVERIEKTIAEQLAKALPAPAEAPRATLIFLHAEGDGETVRAALDVFGAAR